MRINVSRSSLLSLAVTGRWRCQSGGGVLRSFVYACMSVEGSECAFCSWLTVAAADFRSLGVGFPHVRERRRRTGRASPGRTHPRAAVPSALGVGVSAPPGGG